MSWHGQYCPAWKAQQEIAAEREEKTMRDDDAAIQTKENAVE
jgi:hypothetical protein